MKPSYQWHGGMKRMFILVGIFALSSHAFAQGTVSLFNSSSTLISVGGTPMPVSGIQQFIFAIFLAPSTTVITANQTALFTDPAFQIAAGYTTNHPSTPGRITTRPNLDVGTVGGFGGGSTVDFVIRGWSANLGYTWAEFLANWNNGSPSGPANETLWWGSSTVGNDIQLSEVGGEIPSPFVFGLSPNQVQGFNMVTIPEPSSFAVAGLGAAALWLFRRRSL